MKRLTTFDHYRKGFALSDDEHVVVDTDNVEYEIVEVAAVVGMDMDKELEPMGQKVKKAHLLAQEVVIGRMVAAEAVVALVVVVVMAQIEFVMEQGLEDGVVLGFETPE